MRVWFFGVGVIEKLQQAQPNLRGDALRAIGTPEQGGLFEGRLKASYDCPFRACPCRGFMKKLKFGEVAEHLRTCSFGSDERDRRAQVCHTSVSMYTEKRRLADEKEASEAKEAQRSAYTALLVEVDPVDLRPAEAGDEDRTSRPVTEMGVANLDFAPDAVLRLADELLGDNPLLQTSAAATILALVQRGACFGDCLRLLYDDAVQLIFAALSV